MKDGKLASHLGKLRSITTLLIGDFMLDRYSHGDVLRISPEAPVPILKILKKTSRLGGAGNVLLNLIAMSAKTIVFGRIGDDLAGQELFSILKEKKTDTHLYMQKGYKTPVKERLIADSQQILRVDEETNCPITLSLESKIIKDLEKYIAKVDVVAISDYAKGLLSNKILKKLIDLANDQQVPVIVDPKGDDMTKYRGATIIKPNLSEAYLAAKLSKEHPLEQVVKVLFEKTFAKKLIITRSEKGISLFEKGGKRSDFPASIKEVNDVTGAGDTVLATLSVAIASGLALSDALNLANVAAGIAVEHVGCVYVSIKDLAKRLYQLNTESKIFKEKHLFALKHLLKDKHFSILGVDSKEGITTSLFRSIYQIKKQEHTLIIYIKDRSFDEEFIHLLSSISEVDFIILCEKNLGHLCKEINPEAVYEIQNLKLVRLKQIQSLLKNFSKKTPHQISSEK